MGTARQSWTPVLVVRAGGMVTWRLGESTATNGLVTIAECAACKGGAAERHLHRRWRIQTTSGYLLGDLSLPRRGEVQAAASALGEVAIDRRDHGLAVHIEPEPQLGRLGDPVPMGA